MRALPLFACLIAGSVPAGPAWAGPHDATPGSRHSFADVPHWVSVFDDPARDAWQKPDEIVRALGITPGMRVADLGAGTGYFSRRLSEAVGPTGTVFAVELEPALAVHLRERAEQEKTANVVPILASADNPRLPAGGVDLVLVADTYHHLDDRLGYFRRLAADLAPGGRVAVVDWEKRPTPIGPDVAHRLARDTVVGEMEAAGYALVAGPHVLEHQYLLVFRRGDATRRTPP
jgi:predicted methyltransferase